MTRMAGPDCAVMCNLINIRTHTVAAERMRLLFLWYDRRGGFDHCIVGVSWEVWPHAMPVIVIVCVKAWGTRAARRC